jgi:type IX secretion system substrate protein
MKLYFRYFFLISFFILSTSLFGRDKYPTTKHESATSIEYDWTVADIGMLHCYISNYTSISEEFQTFQIGRRDHDYPSMQWLEGGYANNNYLYGGRFYLAYNYYGILFDTETSNDFTVSRFDLNKPADFVASFSLTDDSAGVKKVGVKGICKVLAYREQKYDDFIIYKYFFINNSGIVLEDVYTGLYLDLDISSAGKGSSDKHFAKDDQCSFYLGIDENGNPESISYMWDVDNPNIPGDDTGGRFIPKESRGYAGSRVLDCPPTNHNWPANMQSGHWEDGNYYEPWSDGAYYIMENEEFLDIQYHNEADWRYFQTMGPWDILIADTLKIVVAIGIGERFDGMRNNLQSAYDLYWNIGDHNFMPYITDFYPHEDTLVIYSGDIINFSISTFDKEGDDLVRTWNLNDMYSYKRDSCYAFNSASYPLGINNVSVEVTDNQSTNVQSWIVDIRPAKIYELAQNYPNPFNGTTTIPFELQKDGNVNITIYDVLGRKVKTLINKPYTFGKHTITWDGTDIQNNSVASGIYFYLIQSNEFKSAKRLLWLK